MRSLGVAEEAQLDAVREESMNGARLRRFIYGEYSRRYVPEDVLAAVGMLGKAEQSIALGWDALRYQPQAAKTFSRMPADARRG